MCFFAACLGEITQPFCGSLCVSVLWPGFKGINKKGVLKIIATSSVWLPFEEHRQSVAGWFAEAVNGNLKNYGTELADKQYESGLQ